MELLKIHREALLDKLEETNKQLDLKIACINKERAEKNLFADYMVIDWILLDHTRSIIKTALLNNEIEEV